MDADQIRRRYDRKKYATDIVFSLKNMSFAGTLRDISVGGAFVSTASINQIYEGDRISISIPFTNGQKNVTRRARVLWKNGKGFAIEFY